MEKALRPAVRAEKLSKTYLVAEKEPGLGGTLRRFVHRRYKRLEAAREMSFSIAAG